MRNVIAIFAHRKFNNHHFTPRWTEKREAHIRSNRSQISRRFDVCQMLRIFSLVCVFQLNFTTIFLISSTYILIHKQCTVNVIRGERFMLFECGVISMLLFNCDEESHKSFLKPFSILYLRSQSRDSQGKWQKNKIRFGAEKNKIKIVVKLHRYLKRIKGECRDVRKLIT